MPDDQHTDTPTDTPTVTIRPRWTWLGVALLAIGVGLMGAAVISLILWLAIAGAVVLAAGGVAAWRGNLYNDARTHQSPTGVAADLKQDSAIEVVDPSASVQDPVAQEVALEAHETQQRALHAERGPVSIAPLGIALLLLVALWLAFSQVLVPFTEAGRNTRNSDIYVAIPLALAAFGLRNNVGRAFAYIVVLGCGVALLLLGAFLPHTAAWTMWSQYVSGILVLVGAAVAVGRNGIATLGR